MGDEVTMTAYEGTRDHLRPARDLNLMHTAADDHLAMAEAPRHRVIIEPVSHQRQRGDRCRNLLAGVVNTGWAKAARSRSDAARFAAAAQAIASGR